MKKRIRRDTSVNLSDAIQALKEVSEIRKHESKTVMLTKEELEAKDKEQLVEEEILQRERFSYLNKKYLESMSKNPVLVMPDQNVKSLDMKPRVHVLEDVHFRKALPKTFKYFEKRVPFSEKLGKIKDSKKFMQSISQDMLRTSIEREAKLFKNYNKEREEQT